MQRQRRGALWGLTVPLSTLGLRWLSPAQLAVARFAIAAPPLALLGRRGLRDALAPAVAATGALGLGAVILLQNAGLQRTSVSHAAVIVGIVPVLVALIAAATGRERTGPAGWVGDGVALVGTLAPFWLFARGQARVPAALAGAFVNLEPLVGAVVGWPAFGDAAGPPQLLGGLAVLAGVLLSALPDATLGRLGREHALPRLVIAPARGKV